MACRLALVSTLELIALKTLLHESMANVILDLLELEINLIISTGAKSWQPWSVNITMSFHKDVILLLLFMCCSYDVIFVALDEIRLFVNVIWKRADENVDLYLKTNLLNFFDQKKYKYEIRQTNCAIWRHKLICDRNINTKCHFEQKIIENLGQSQRNSTKERLLWRRKSTSRLIECPIFQSPLEQNRR